MRFIPGILFICLALLQGGCGRSANNHTSRGGPEATASETPSNATASSLPSASGAENSAENNPQLLAEKIAELKFKIQRLEERKYNFAKSPPRLPLPQEMSESKSFGKLLEAKNRRRELEAILTEVRTAADPSAFLHDLKQKRAELLELFTQEHPGVKKVDRKIALLTEALSKAPEGVVSFIEARYQAAKENEDRLRAKIKSPTLLQYEAIDQELEASKQELSLLRQRQLENK